MRYTPIKSYNILSYFNQLDHVMQTLLENFLQMVIHNVLSCSEQIQDGLGGKWKVKQKRWPNYIVKEVLCIQQTTILKLLIKFNFR